MFPILLHQHKNLLESHHWIQSIRKKIRKCSRLLNCMHLAFWNLLVLSCLLTMLWIVTLKLRNVQIIKRNESSELIWKNYFVAFLICEIMWNIYETMRAKKAICVLSSKMGKKKKTCQKNVSLREHGIIQID